MNQSTGPERLRSPKQIAAILDRSERTVRAWSSAGCPSYLLAGCRRFKESEVREWLKTRAPAPKLKPAPGKRGQIYFIGAVERWPIKIGWSVRADGRRPSLQTGTWENLICHGTILGTQADERAIHEELAAHHVRGEWFERGPALELLRRRTSEVSA